MADEAPPPTLPAVPYAQVQAARDAGYSDTEIANHVASITGQDLSAARKAGYDDAAILDYLSPQPKPPPKPEPVSGTLKGMGKAAGQEAITSVAQTVSGVGAVTKMVGGAERQETNVDLDLIQRFDQGEDFRGLMKGAPNDLARLALRQYQVATPEQRQQIKQSAINTKAAPEGQLELSGEHIQKAGEKLTDYAKAAIPLTPEEESRSTVIGTKMVVGLTKYIGAALAGGMPAVVGIAGVDAFGDTYDKARLAGRTDAEATGDAMINGMVQGGLMTVPIGQATKVFDLVPVALKGEFVKALAEAGKSGLTLVGFSQVATIADNVVAKSTYDPTRKPLEGVGEHLPETFVAGAVLPLAAAGMARVARGRSPAEVARPVLDEPTLDGAIEKSREIVSEPVDVNAIATQAREFGGLTEGDQQQAKLNQLFGGLNEGEVRPTQDGGYVYARGDQEVPLNVWDEKAATGETGGTEAKPSPSTISPGLAAAQREHYQKLGIDVVYFEDPAGKVGFDGAVDPQNPNTVFLSNNPQRNAAQVGAHELTHVLESTTLPDGTSLADILHGQVRAGMTPEGLTHALDVFGKTAPERAAFPEGAGGDAAHGDAVIRHLVAELGADIGGEAPKFQTFIPKVVDEVRQRYGDDAAKSVVQKLIAGIQQAMRTLREFFFHPEEHAEYGQPETASQRWVTNLEEIHGTLAKMYAERFGTRAEKENVALADMRDRAQRERFVKTGNTAPENAALKSGYEPGAAYEGARKKAETYRRWIGELERQGASDADVGRVREAFFNERRRMAEALSAQPAEQVGTGPQRRLEAPPAVTPPPGSKVTPENVFQPETYGAPRGSAPTAASSASAPAAKPATPERAEPHPVLPPAPSSAFDYKLAHEVETVWADKSIMGATHRGVARNEDFARDVARERLMREEAAPQVERAIKEDGLPEDRIPAVAKLFRPAEGESMEEAFNKAVDRYMTIEEAKGSQATLDPDVANYDMLKAEWATDPVLGEAFDRLDKHYAGENKGEIPGDEDIPFGTAETTPAQGAGQEAARGEAGRPEGQEAGGKPGVGREAPAQEEALAAPGGAAEPAKPQQAVEAPEGQPKAEATPAAKPATPPPIVAEPPKPKTSEMMQDAGEKIGGARKDRWAERGLRVADLEGMTEGEAFQHTTKDQVWPKPDYAKLVEGGMAPEAAARVKIIRDRLAAKPSKDSAEGRRQYIEMMGHVRDVLVNAKTADDVRTARDAIIYERAGVPREGRASPEAKAARELMFSVYKGRSEPFHLTYQDQRKAQQMVADGFPGKADPWTRRYMIRENSAGEFYVSAKTAYKQLSSYFKDRTDAETAARDLYDKEGGKAAEAPVPKRPHLDEIKRTGADVRGGKDVTGDDFVKDFGFRGVEFGNWVASDERQKSVNLAYDALHDMAGVIGVPPEALSLDGKLGLAFGARGSGQFAAHYEPGRLVINLTKLSGAGSLAHEWAHALDHYFGELDREGGTRGEARGASGWYTKTDQRTSYLGNLRAEMAQAFDRVMDVIFKREKPRAEAVRDAELRLETIQAGIDGYRERAEKSTDAGFKKQVDDYIARQTLQLDAAGRRLATLRDEAQPYTGQKVTSSYYQEANKLSGKSGEQGYWSRPTEMFARAFESFVFDKIKEAGNKSDYLVQGVEAARYAKGYKGNPYPAAERPAINAAFQHLFDTMETREGEGGRRVLFSPRGENEPKGPTLLDTREATPEELAARQRVRDKEEAEARMRGRKGGKVPQESADETPLFGGPRQSTLFSPRDERPFYSALTRGVEGLKLEKGTPGQWEATVRNMPGVKAEERAWVGLEDWLRQQTKSVTKAEVLGYLREHEVKVSEVQRGGGVPESAVKALEDWIDKEYGKAEPGDQNADIAPGTWEGLRRGDAEAISNVEAWGAPDHLMKPIYDSIGGGATKFGSYVLPGGKNYKELLLTLPTKSQFDVRNAEGRYRLFDNKANDWVRTPDGKLRTGYDSQADAQRAAQGLNETAGSNPMGNFRGGHWDEPNVLAHARFDDRTGPNGEKVLHLAEIQSDWHQKGRKQGYAVQPEDKFDVYNTKSGNRSVAFDTRQEAEAYRAALPATLQESTIVRVARQQGTSGVPDAPFKTSWPELAMKRMLRYAADNGYDRVSWDTGETNADRYDLSKQVRELTYTGDDRLIATGHKGEMLINKVVAREELPDVIGKEAADKLLAQQPKRYSGDIDDNTRHLTGTDLKVGGEGMKAFYDKQLPVIANKIGKRFGAKVEDTNINGEHPGPMRVASDGTRYWLESHRTGERVSDYFDSAAAAMDAREAKFHGPEAHSIEITPAMREGVQQGQPLFSPKQTESPEFKRWFEGSKAVDEKTGKPLVVYHGTPEEVQGGVFKAPAFFTEQAKESEFYSMGRHARDGGRTYPVYLDIKNPVDARTAEGNELLISIAERAGVKLETDIHETHSHWHFHSEDIKRATPYDGDNVNDLMYLPKVREQMRKEGYDGLRAWDGGGMDFETPIWVPLDPGQVKSAIGNRGTFDAGNPDIRMSPRDVHANPDRDYTPEQETMLKRQRATETPTWGDWWNKATANAGTRLAVETVDRYAGIKKRDPGSYIGQRIANSSEGAKAVWLTEGTLATNGKAYDLRDRNGGARELLKPLKEEVHDFFFWVASHRAEELAAEDREHRFTPEDIAAGKTLNRGQLKFDYELSNGQTTRSREAAYTDALGKLNVLNQNILDIAVKRGLLTRDVGDVLMKNQFYVPFFRERADGTAEFVGPMPTSSTGMAKQTFGKRLTGGTEKLNSDLVQNWVDNASHIIDAAAKNGAAHQTLETAVTDGIATKLTEQQYTHLSDKQQKAESTWVMVDGKKQYYHVQDPLLFKAVGTLAALADPFYALSAARVARRVLQVGVTHNPVFAVRNLARDSLQALATTPQSANVFNTIATGMRGSDTMGSLNNLARAVAGRELGNPNLSENAVRLLAGGGSMRIASLSDTGVSKVKLGSLLDSSEKLGGWLDGVGKAMHAYSEAVGKGEEFNRIALYENLREKGVPHDIASFSAQDLTDFSLSGANPIVRYIRETVPFTNSRAQGLYKVGRALSGSDAAMFKALDASVAAPSAKNAAAVTLLRTAGTLIGLTVATMALDAIYSDDPEYQQRTEYDRQNYWYFRVGEERFRVPMPFEVGALSRIAADTALAFFDNRMTVNRWASNTWASMQNNLGFGFIPQVVSPIMDIATNTSGTGQAIEPKGMENVRPDQRYTINNTMAARGASSAINSLLRALPGMSTVQGPSPMQIDYLTKAYGGWLGSAGLGTADTAIRSFTSEPVRPAGDTWATATQGLIETSPRSASRYVDALYKQAKDVDQAFATYRDKLSGGQAVEAQKFFQDNRDLIARHGLVDGIVRLESNLNRQIRMITDNPDPKVTPEQKRIQIMRLQAIKNQAAERVIGAQR